MRLHGSTVRHLQTLQNLGVVGSFTDTQLLDLFRSNRDEAAELAFAVLVDRHGPMVLNVCRTILRNDHDAHDAFQTTFLVLAKKASTLKLRESLAPWLHQVARRTAASVRSAQARRARHEQNAGTRTNSLIFDKPDDDVSIILHEEIDRLPSRYRTAVVLCLLDGLSADQAAQQLGWPPGTVRSRLARGRTILRTRLTRRGLTPAVIPPVEIAATVSSNVPTALAKSVVSLAMESVTRPKAAAFVTATFLTLFKEGLKTSMTTKLMVASGMSLALGVTVSTIAYQATATHPIAHLQSPAPSDLPANTKPAGQRPEDFLAIQPIDMAVSLALSADGSMLIASCMDGAIHVLDANTGKKRMTLAETTERRTPRKIVLTPDSKTVIGVNLDQQLWFWDLATHGSLKTVMDLRKPGSSPRARITNSALAVSPSGRLIAVGFGGTVDPARVIRLGGESVFEIQVLDLETGELIWSHNGRKGYVDQLVFSPDGSTLATTTHGDIRLWDAQAGDLKQTLKPSDGTVFTLAFSPDSRLMAGFGSHKVDTAIISRLTIWDLASGSIISSIGAGKSGGVSNPDTLAFSPDGKTIATAGSHTFEGQILIHGRNVGRGKKSVSHVKLWNVETSALLWTSAVIDGSGSAPGSSLLFSPDGQSLFCCDNEATIRIDARTGQLRQELMRVGDRP